MHAVQNIVRVALGMAWTAILGIPLLVVLYARYLVALLARGLGARDWASAEIDRNAVSAGVVAQRWWAPALIRLARIRVNRIDRDSIDWSRSHVICANHASIFDIIALVSVVPVPFRFVAKPELLKWPIIGWALHPTGQIVIDRSDRAAAIEAIEREVRDGLQGQVIFFVEGTRSRDGRLRRFKKGAFHFALDHGLPLLPTAICGSHGVLGRTVWWKMHGGREIEVVFRSPIDPESLLAGADKPARLEAGIEAVRRAIGDELARRERTQRTA